MPPNDSIRGLMRKPLHEGRRGIALVIALSMIVLITILVVSFTSSMRTERQASHTMTENERTKLVAETALAHAISILSSNIPQPVPPVQPVNGSYPAPPAAVNWSINPGLLNVITGPSTVTQIPLSTNPGTHYVSNTGDANLNLLQATSNQYPILGTPDPMYVAWAPLLQNPAAAASAANPLVARYAFWIDDENAKINVNTAYGKLSGMDYTKPTPGAITEAATAPISTTDLFPLGHPGSVNLSVLGPAVNPTSLLNSLKTYGAAKSPEIIKTALNGGSDADTFYQQNKFFLTATSRDPEFNVFGKPRLYMYASPPGQLDTKLGGGLFQRFRDLDAPMYFHGSENRDPAVYPGGNPFQDYGAMYYTAVNLSSILNRTDWPGMPARSFVNKWGGNDPTVFDDAAHREADQIAWNMVAMGSFSDCSSYTTATPGLAATLGNHLPPGKTGSSGSINYPNAAVQVGRTIPAAVQAGKVSGKAIIPVTPRPMVDEICVNILPEAVTVDGVSKYRLKFTASYGLWLPPGYPTADLTQQSCDVFVGLTHLEYSATQGATKATQADTKYLNNGYDGVKKMQALDNLDTLTPDQRLTVLSIRNVPDPDLTPQFYARNGSGFSNSTVGVTNFLPSTVTVTMRMRFYVHSISSYYAAATQVPPSQLIPVWDTHDPGTIAAPTTWNAAAPGLDQNSQVYKAFHPPTDDPDDCVEFNFNLDLAQVGGTQCTRSLRVADPRTSGLSRMWKPSWKDSSGNDLPDVAGTALTDSLGAAHNAETDAAVASGQLQLNKFAYVDMQANTALPHPSIGMFSLVPTGMQRGIIGASLKLQPNSSTTDLPDWLLLDLFAPTVSPPSTSTAWADIVKMNATAGKININAAIYPDAGSFAPPPRLLPLQALFTNTPAGTNTPVATLAKNIVNHTLASGGSTYAGGVKFYDYPGEVCEIKGVADAGSTDFDKEATVRNFASAITTKSNTFSVWGVAQSIKKLSTNHQYAQYESGDVITGEKRFQAIVERYVWPGADGVAGNGRVNSGGTYDLLTQGATQPGMAPSNSGYTWETLDGPDAPTYPISTTTDADNVTMSAAYDPYNKNATSTYVSSTLENANNPVRAAMKYRVIYFKYLD